MLVTTIFAKRYKITSKWQRMICSLKLFSFVEQYEKDIVQDIDKMSLK